MNLTNRQKIAHLLRRFGLGASDSELAHLEPMGVDAALDFLLNYEGHDEGFNVSPWEICHEPDKTDVCFDSYRFAAWWALRLVMTQRPVEQKITLFWHNHFAVSGEKIDFGPMLLTYLETLRTNAMGDFPTLLKSVSKDPAMLRYLDGDTSVRNHPNENFARKLLELFTLGEGNYLEQDIQESSRALTGWGIRYLLYNGDTESFQAKLKSLVARKMPLVTASFSPDLFDSGAKTILGRQANFDSDSLLDEIAIQPRTAYFITQKMWKFFACDEITSSVANQLAGVFLKTNGNTRAILEEIAKTDEFWGDQCVRKQVKSPVDFNVAILRQLGLYPVLASIRSKDATSETPLAQPLRDVAGMALTTMTKQGMTLLFPPNAGGWHWGEAWITPNNMLARVQFADALFGVDQPEQPLAAFLGKQIADTNSRTSFDAITQFLSMFDADIPAVKQTILIEAFDKAGSLPSLKNASGTSKSLSAVARLLFSSPEFQVC